MNNQPHLNRAHSEFNIDMEVLCTLPMWPITVKLSSLAEDMGMDTQQELRDAIKRLQDMGHSVVTGRSEDKGFCAWVEPRGWHRVQAEGQEYWDRVYDECESIRS
jgi:hypothetical protein